MKELDNFYLRALHAGLTHLRAAADGENLEWLYHEAEHLHNMPSLIGESNIQRHSYRFTEAQAYLEWLRATDSEIKNHCGIAYLPLWQEFDSILPLDKMMKSSSLEPDASDSSTPPTCHYLMLLSSGLISVRDSARLKNPEWSRAEIEHLDQLMPLLGEPNSKPHRDYLIEKERHATWLDNNRRKHNKTHWYRHFWDALENYFSPDKRN